ncbi:hypothetical protein IWQ60_010101 [Tieghemiomyces parasiticus]|uniref:Uncharacterized protein n=1 Tax=Tieghemiomyces parasiticus TaxID=78921 RepID=A0A9W7ZSG6_9FUNG|nr:hypothetical protein IWQ60_010101 [Tieghemiomyces parasiticus]
MATPLHPPPSDDRAQEPRAPCPSNLADEHDLVSDSDDDSFASFEDAVENLDTTEGNHTLTSEPTSPRLPSDVLPTAVIPSPPAASPTGSSAPTPSAITPERQVSLTDTSASSSLANGSKCDPDRSAAAGHTDDPQEITVLDAPQSSAPEPSQAHKTPKSTEDKSELPEPVEPERPAAPKEIAATGWGSWSTFLTSAETIYSQAQKMTENLKDISIDDVYAKIDPDFKRAAGTEAASTESSDSADGPPNFATLFDRNAEKRVGPTDSSHSQAAEGDVATTQHDTINSLDRSVVVAGETGDLLLGTLDKTFDFASNLLGSAVLGGYRTLEQANLSDKLAQLRANPEAKQALDRSLKLGENAMRGSLAALENLGRSAVDVVNEKRLAAQTAADPSVGSVAPERPHENSWDGCFRKYKGALYFQTTQEIADEKVGHLTAIITHAPALGERCTATFADIDQLFAKESTPTEAEGTGVSRFSSSNTNGTAAMEELFSALQVEDPDEFHMMQEISEEVEEFREDGSSATITEFTEGETVVARQTTLDGFHRTAFKTLAEFAVVACKLMLALTNGAAQQIEKFHKNPTDAGYHATTALDLARRYHTVLDHIMGEVRWVGRVFAQTADELLAAAPELDMEDPAAFVLAALQEDLDRTESRIRGASRPLPAATKLLHAYIMSVAEA